VRGLYRWPVQIIDKVPVHVDVIEFTCLDGFEDDVGGKLTPVEKGNDVGAILGSVALFRCSVTSSALR